MLTDGEKFKKKRTKNRDVLAETNKFWSDRQKVEAVTLYLTLGGNLAQTAKITQIPEATLRNWKRSEWWNELVNDIHREDRLVLSTKLKKIVERSWDIVGDRIENGDYIYSNKTGELIRKPVNLRDVSQVARDATRLRTELDIAENYTVAQDQIQDKLSKLAESFQALAQGKPLNKEADDIEYVEEVDSEGEDSAVHEEREEGLQEGECSVQLPPGTEESPQ